MELSTVFSDSSLKSKEKVALLAGLISTDPALIPDVLAEAPEAHHATVLEALEYVSQDTTFVLPQDALRFAESHLSSNMPRARWEAAKVIGNTIRHYPEMAEALVAPLIKNAGDPGTVVRWSAARALGEILRLRLPLNEDLAPRIAAVADREQKDSITKIYRKALADVAR